MVHHIAKRQKVDEQEAGGEAVLFNSDTLSKIISYIPSIDVLNLALANKRFGISDNNDDDISIIEESTRIAIQDIATEEELATLPYYNGENSLADYHYLQFMRGPLTFDQLDIGAEYVDSLYKSCVRHSERYHIGTAFSNNIMRVGKHYVIFEATISTHSYMGVMRPGQANQEARGFPCGPNFYRNFSPCNFYNDNDIQCCVYNTGDGDSYSSNWLVDNSYLFSDETWEGSESISLGDELGMLLDLDEGTLSVYKNGRKLGVMKRGLAGPYCWVVSITRGVQVTIKRGTIPPS